MARPENYFRYILKKIKSRDTQKAVKTNVGHNEWSHFAIHFYHFAVSEKQNILKDAV
jgi:hypothetical protein